MQGHAGFLSATVGDHRIYLRPDLVMVFYGPLLWASLILVASALWAPILEKVHNWNVLGSRLGAHRKALGDLPARLSLHSLRSRPSWVEGSSPGGIRLEAAAWL